MYLGINTREKNPIDEIRESFIQSGIALPAMFLTDGEVHRFRADYSKPEDNDNGWYVFFTNGDAVNGVYGDWASDLKVKFHSSQFETLSVQQKQEMNNKVQEAIKTAAKEREQKQLEVSDNCIKTWNNLKEAGSDHPYLALKGLKNGHCARLDGDKLVIPLTDKNGRIWSLQTIDGQGNKKYKAGGKVKGCFYQIGQGIPKYLCEGFATGCSIYEATGKTTIVSFSAGNMVDVAKSFPGLTVVADNDESRTGENKAKETGLSYILIPEKGMDANDYAHKYGLEKLAEVCKVKKAYRVHSGLDWLKQGTPRSWLIKNWVLKGPALQMTFGPSGGGKTFVNIDRMLSIATGYDATKSKVMYLCGEGSQSAQARVAVWVQEHQINLEDLKDNLLIVEEEFKLDTPEGINLIYNIIDDYSFVPDIVIVDTLIRFMDGDENDTKAANQFITYCSEIQNKYNCTLLLTHHTGLAENAQKRARGSSAFKGALDMQDMVEKHGEKICLTQIKNKGGRIQETKTFELEDHSINNFFEDDGSNMICAILKQLDNTEESKPKIVSKKQQADEDLIIHAFIEKGSLIMGKPYIRSEDLIDWLVIQNDSTRDVERRKISIRNIDYKDKPRLMERLENYGDVEVDWGEKNTQVPRGFWCNGIERNGLIQPNFDMSLG